MRSGRTRYGSRSRVTAGLRTDEAISTRANKTVHAASVPIANGRDKADRRLSLAKVKVTLVEDEAAEQARKRIAPLGAEETAGEVPAEADSGKEQHERPQRTRSDAAELCDGTFGKKGQDDNGHHTESRRGPELVVVDAVDQRVRRDFSTSSTVQIAMMPLASASKPCRRSGQSR